MMDEPSLGLAPLIVDELAPIIKGINAMGVGVILVEQNVHAGPEDRAEGPTFFTWA